MELNEDAEATGWPRHFELDELGSGESDVIGRDLLAFFIGGGNESTAGKVVGFSEEAGGTLLDGGDGLRAEELGFDPGDGEVVG